MVGLKRRRIVGARRVKRVNRAGQHAGPRIRLYFFLDLKIFVVVVIENIVVVVVVVDVKRVNRAGQHAGPRIRLSFFLDLKIDEIGVEKF